MSNTSINISGQIYPDAIQVYIAISEVCAQLEIPYMVVGASARDIVLHFGHGAKIQRATRDIDFGIQVPNWKAFQSLKQELLSRGFQESRQQHKLVSASGVPIDIVPFGQLEDDNANISWPPDGDWVMNVLGFQEACKNAEIVRVQDAPPVDIPVATPEGMTVLKLIAWTDRSSDMRSKDAKDLLYLFTTYHNIPKVKEQVFDDENLMEAYEWDIELASAHQLGKDARNITEKQTRSAIETLLNGKHEKLSIDQLILEMGERHDTNYDRHAKLLNSFAEGFLDHDQ
jgi:predicted nucleotidyltransferase